MIRRNLLFFKHVPIMITLTNYLTSSSLNRLIQWCIQYVIDIAAEICADDCSPVSYDVHDEDGCVNCSPETVALNNIVCWLSEAYLLILIK
ncbi:hypothetical protein FWK35_00011694 [Aphis craccivora]|uniref:Uncharacterized protein n=1 Tax=Aphis craccivora TaxID=307492 RepID=A0A6G0YXK7_APHCR|nr:hypothetical protein FWK35_00011694 [Aphis craccivora]